jgi:putative ABC transport system permease protein
MSSPGDISFVEVAAALGLVAIAVAISLWQRMRLEGDIAIAVARSFVQLTAVGFVIQLVFDADSILLVIALVAGMAVFGAFTARGRAPAVPHAFAPLLIALALAGTATLVLLVALGIFRPEPRYLVPLGGMVVGNSMTAAAVALGRLGDEVTGSWREIEATLALGATATQAVRPIVRRSLRSGVTPLIDSTKTTGVIFFPGIMVGLLVAGAAPLDAVRLQLIILYMLLGSVAIASVTAVVLAQRSFFTAAHQLREPADAAAPRASG